MAFRLISIVLSLEWKCKNIEKLLVYRSIVNFHGWQISSQAFDFPVFRSMFMNQKGSGKTAKFHPRLITMNDLHSQIIQVEIDNCFKKNQSFLPLIWVLQLFYCNRKKIANSFETFYGYSNIVKVVTFSIECRIPVNFHKWFWCYLFSWNEFWRNLIIKFVMV